MQKLREVTVFSTNGNPRDIATWSNVPYFLVDTLEKQGIKVNTVNLEPSIWKRRLYNKIFKYFFLNFLKNTTYNYYRTNWHFINSNKKIKRFISKYSTSDAFIFTTFSFSANKFTTKPTILLCDWSYEYYFEYFENRKPGYFEKKCINRENEQIKKSEIVITLYKGFQDYLASKNVNINYLGNVINSEIQNIEISSILQKKKDSDKILFIGKNHYKKGAIDLINAFVKLKYVNNLLELHIVGMSTEDFDSLPKDVYCHGYLNKGIEKEKELYYALIKDAKLIINTTPKWGGFSSIIEAMYYYTPIITIPYKEFVITFGENLQFGAYATPDNSDSIVEKTHFIINHADYTEFCINAHEAVKNFTWENYVNSLIEKIENYNTEK